uniref:Uncharacterized protein n=1 Tax=Polysiphonia sp. TaxID=1967842 RepID=A0A1Z1MTS4_9FLOR|nr:hypothetical protein [Polysiphonia sp.]
MLKLSIGISICFYTNSNCKFLYTFLLKIYIYWIEIKFCMYN